MIGLDELHFVKLYRPTRRYLGLIGIFDTSNIVCVVFSSSNAVIQYRYQ